MLSFSFETTSRRPVVNRPLSLVSLVFALLIEQARPLQYRRFVHAPLSRLAEAMEAFFNAGEGKYGVIAWLAGVGGCTLLATVCYVVLLSLSPLLALLFNVGILYLTMGFRQFSHYYTDIQLALRMQDLPRARSLLAEWRGQPAERASSAEIARLAIEEALAGSHRHVFGVLLWFVLLPGPSGAVLYRVAAVFAEVWAKPADGERDETFARFAKRALAVIDWLPLRATAAAFAVVGNFEDAVYCWRTQAANWPAGMQGDGMGIVLASGAGALGVRLGLPLRDAGGANGAELGSGLEADVDFMQSAVGLVWRAIVLWVLLLLLLGLASMVGG